MKKTLAVILATVLLFALVPAVASADNSVELEIKGGQTNVNMETVNGVSCLKVEAWLNGIDSETLITSVGFALLYDSTQLTFEKDTQNALQRVDQSGKIVGSATMLTNATEAGVIRFAMADTFGCKLKQNTPLVTLYFRLADALPLGTEINFRLAAIKNNGEISQNEKPILETVQLADLIAGNVTTVKHPMTANFKPYTISNITGTIEWNPEDVEFKGKVPFVLANGKAQTPRFTVKDDEGNVIDPSNYDYEFKENTLPGTGYLFVTFKNGYSGGCDSFFKIYLPASEWLTVENVEEGVRLEWAPVEGAAGYVIYRRAWSTTTNGWTTFERWWNVTETTWTDGTILGHKVYAGTRYQYGIKAYFTQRLDPVSGDLIGGNENAPLGNYNLGIVGPLKTTVRITTRVLNSVEGGSKQITAKWSASKNFTGYEVQLATDDAFTKDVKSVVIDDWHTAETTFKSLKANTTYYVRVRSYHIFEGMTYYGQWSNVMSAKTN